MKGYFYLLLLLLFFNFNYVNSEVHFYLDNQTLCNDGFVQLDNVHVGRIYSHMDFHNKYFYLHDHHCSITIQTKKRVWMSIDYFQSNSSVAFPRCTEAKYAGKDDRLQILDGDKNGSILRIICGKDTDQRFDHSPLILKSSTFTIDWQTKSQSFGFELRFVLYDLAMDGQCPNASQYQCKNRRCIDRSLICSEEDFCGDESYIKNQEICPKKTFKQRFFNWRFFLFIFICFVLVFILLCIMRICQRQRKTKEYISDS